MKCAGNPMSAAVQALSVVSLLSPPTFRSRSLLSVILPHCPRQRARRFVNCALLLAFMSVLGTAAPHWIRTTFASRHRPRRSGDPADISQLVSKRNACVRGGHVRLAVQQVLPWTAAADPMVTARAPRREDRGERLNIPARSASRAFFRRMSVGSDETFTRHMSFHRPLRSQQCVVRRVC